MKTAITSGGADDVDEGHGQNEAWLAREDRDAMLEDLHAARTLCATYDPDSPPWAAEPELRRLELLVGQARD